MAADLHIHVCTNRQQLAAGRQHHRMRMMTSGPSRHNPKKWQRLYGWHEMKVGPMWFHEDDYFRLFEAGTSEKSREKIRLQRYKRAEFKTPNCWIGEVSWLKAGLTGDSESFIPEVVQVVQELFNKKVLTKIDDSLIEKVTQAFDKAKPHEHYECAEKDKVIAFLMQHKGRRAFTISW